MPRPILLAALLLLAPAASAGEVVTRHDLGTGIGETRLENGLTVLTLERHHAPVVSVQIWYRVGSADEARGETGLAHFLEHLMFKGTDRYRKGEIDRLTLELGGSNNAATSKDFTEYYFSLASDRYETALEIEANRMRNLAFDPVEFEAERKVVLEELQAGNDSPWTELFDTVEATAFLAHPYAHPVIGWRPDLERVSRERVKAFYDLHYHPRNATLVLVGDFDTRKALARIVDLFGPIPAGPERPDVRTPEPPPAGERECTVETGSPLARLIVLHQTVPVSHPDDAVLDVASRVLAGSRASRLYRRLVDGERLASSVEAWNDSRRDPGLFGILAEALPDVDPERLLSAICEETDRLGREAPAEDEVARARAAILTDLVFRRATAEGRADEIGFLATIGDWRLTATAEARIRAVTPQDVRRVAATLLTERRRTVGRSVRGMAAETGGGDGPAEEPRRAPRGPAAGPVPSRHLSPVVRVLANGLTLIAARDDTVPVLAVAVHARDARLREAKPGLAEFHGEYLLEGAGDRDAEALAFEIERRGARISTSAHGLTARARSEEAESLVGLLADLLGRPRFPAASLPALRQRQIAKIAAEQDDPATVGAQALRAAVYGPHPLGRPGLGTPESVAEFTEANVRSHHETFFSARNLVLAAVSDLPPEDLLALLEDALAGLPGTVAPAAAPLPAIPDPVAGETRIVRDTDQAHVFLGHRGVRRSDPDFIPLLVMDFVLGRGPGFTDRLSRTLRDRDGLAYEVWAGIAGSADEEPGTFTAYIGTSPATATRAADGIVAEVRRMREAPPEPAELSGAKAYLTGSFAFSWETAEQIAARLVDLHRLGLGFDYPDRYAALVNAVTAEDVLRVAREHLDPDRLTKVVVGPAAN